MDRGVYAALTRLEQLLPLAERQAALAPDLVAVHRRILHGLAEQGRMPDQTELRVLLQQGNIRSALATLADQDLIVLDASGQPVGAYPLCLETTAYRIHLHGHDLYAMCAIDALAIAPLFAAEVRIESTCPVSGEALRIHQRGKLLMSVLPDRDLHTGVRWQPPGRCAAHSLCREMVLLRDASAAADWAAQGDASVSILDLDQSIELGASFFRPLLG